VWRCLRDPMFSRFSRTPTCDRETETHDYGTYRASMASRGNRTEITIICSCGSEIWQLKCRMTDAKRVQTGSLSCVVSACLVICSVLKCLPEYVFTDHGGGPGRAVGLLLVCLMSAFVSGH